MKNIIFCLLGCLLTSPTHAQTDSLEAYMQLFIPGRTVEDLDARVYVSDFLPTDSGFLWLYINSEYGTGETRCVLRKTDRDLRPTDSLVLSDWLDTRRCNGFKIARKGDFYYIFGGIRTDNNQYLQEYFILGLTEDLEIRERRIFPYVDKIIDTYTYCVNNAGHFVTANMIVDPTDATKLQAIFMEINTEGQVLRSAVLNINPFLLGGLVQDISGDYCMNYNTTITILDPDFKVKKTIVVPAELGTGCQAKNGVPQSADLRQSVFHYTCQDLNYDPVLGKIIRTNSDELMHYRNNRVKRLGAVVVHIDNFANIYYALPTIAANPEMSRFYFGGFYQSYLAAPAVKTIVSLHSVDSNGTLLWSRLYKSPIALVAFRYVWLPDSSVLMLLAKPVYDNGIVPLPVQMSMYYVKVNKHGQLVPPRVSGVSAASAAPLQVRLWPNPAQGELRLQGTAVSEGMCWRITDLNGRVLLSGKNEQAAAGGFSIDTGALPNGLYFVVMETEEGRRCVRKFSVAARP